MEESVPASAWLAAGVRTGAARAAPEHRGDVGGAASRRGARQAADAEEALAAVRGEESARVGVQLPRGRGRGGEGGGRGGQRRAGRGVDGRHGGEVSTAAEMEAAARRTG